VGERYEQKREVGAPRETKKGEPAQERVLRGEDKGTKRKKLGQKSVPEKRDQLAQSEPGEEDEGKERTQS